MSDFPTQEFGPYVECTAILFGFDNTTALSRELVISDTDPFYYILEGIDYTATGGTPTPVHFQAQHDGVIFDYNGQSIGSEQGVQHQWRGKMILWGAATFNVSISSTLNCEMGFIAWGRYVGTPQQLPF